MSENDNFTEAEAFACCHKVLLMIGCLHQLGYQKLRVFCYGRMMWWRGVLGPGRLFSTTHVACYSPTESEKEEGLVALFGTGSACKPFGWEENVASMSVEQMADLFVERFPVLANESRGSDREYARWFQEMLSHTSAEKLPVAYAVDEYESTVFDPIRFYVYLTGYSEDTVPLPPSSSLVEEPIMSERKIGNEAAIKAWETMRQRGKPPQFDTNTPEGRVLKHAYKAASAAIGRAKKNGLVCDEEWMLDSPQLIIEQNFRCKATGLEFDVDNFKTNGAGGTHRAPSPDQIEAGMGYVRGNVQWVLWAVNRAKGEMHKDNFAEICRAVVERNDAQD